MATLAIRLFVMVSPIPAQSSAIPASARRAVDRSIVAVQTYVKSTVARRQDAQVRMRQRAYSAKLRSAPGSPWYKPKHAMVQDSATQAASVRPVLEPLSVPMEPTAGPRVK